MTTPLLGPRPRLLVKITRPQLHAARPRPVSREWPERGPPVATNTPCAATIAAARARLPGRGLLSPGSAVAPPPQPTRPATAAARRAGWAPAREERAAPAPRPAKLRRRRGRRVRSARPDMPTRERVRTATAERGAHLASAGVRVVPRGLPREPAEAGGAPAAISRAATATQEAVAGTRPRLTGRPAAPREVPRPNRRWGTLVAQETGARATTPVPWPGSGSETTLENEEPTATFSSPPPAPGAPVTASARGSVGPSRALCVVRVAPGALMATATTAATACLGALKPPLAAIAMEGAPIRGS